MRNEPLGVKQMFGKLKTNEVALLLYGLRACWVSDMTKEHKKLTTALEGELAARGATLLDGELINTPAKKTG